MTSYNLNATPFKQVTFGYEKELKRLLSKFTECYKLMLISKVKLENDENIIRDVLYVNYLNNNEIRNKLNLIDFLFDREVPEDNTEGRTDIKINTIKTFENTEAYYIIECKRLDSKNLTGTTGLNAKYIKNGILRFVEKRYSAYYQVNGMIGFIIEHMDIDKNIQNINMLLKNNFNDANTRKKLTFVDFIKNFKHSYFSTHKDVKGKEIKLYHLMFDFSKNLVKREHL